MASFAAPTKIINGAGTKVAKTVSKELKPLEERQNCKGRKPESKGKPESSKAKRIKTSHMSPKASKKPTPPVPAEAGECRRMSSSRCDGLRRAQDGVAVSSSVMEGDDAADRINFIILRSEPRFFFLGFLLCLVDGQLCFYISFRIRKYSTLVTNEPKTINSKTKKYQKQTGPSTSLLPSR